MSEAEFKHWGEFDNQGAIIRDTPICAVTGEHLRVGEGTICRVQETNLFFRVKPAAYRRLTREQRAEIETRVREASQAGVAADTLAQLPSPAPKWEDPTEIAKKGKTKEKGGDADQS